MLHQASAQRGRVVPVAALLESFSRTYSFLPDNLGQKLTMDSTYPGQSGINPFPMDWGNKDPQLRGPVVESRGAETVRRRNGTFDNILCETVLTIQKLLEVGKRKQETSAYLHYKTAHGGSYSIYYALAVASREIRVDHRYVQKLKAEIGKHKCIEFTSLHLLKQHIWHNWCMSWTRNKANK
jgi:hypothetical protein